MELTNQYFGEELAEFSKLNKRISAWKEKGKDVLSSSNQQDQLISQMSRKFKSLYEGDYSLTGSDVAHLLDVTESYLFLKLKDKLDFIKPPREAFSWVNDKLDLIEDDLFEFNVVMSRSITLSKEQQKKYNQLKIMKKELKSLKRKKVFVSKESVVRFLKETVDVEIENKQVVINKKDLNAEYSAKAMSKLIDEFKSTISDDYSNNEKIVSYTKLSGEVIEQILSYKLQIYSGKSIKEDFVRSVNFTGYTVHDTQLYRYLDNKAAYSKLIMKSTVPDLKKKAKNQSLVRYLLNIEIERQLFNMDEDADLIVFSVSVKDYYDEIAQDFIEFVNDQEDDTDEDAE